jgi:hypothetical protein
MNEITATGDFAKNAITAAPNSRGTIFSDVNGTLVSLKDGTSFYKEYAVFLAAMQHSGYEVILHSLDSNGNANLLPLQFMQSGTGVSAEQFEYDGQIVQSKTEDTRNMSGIVAFDDDQESHYANVRYRFDTNDAHTKAGIEKIAAEFEASGRTKIFNFDAAMFAAPVSPAPVLDRSTGPV